MARPPWTDVAPGAARSTPPARVSRVPPHRSTRVTVHRTCRALVDGVSRTAIVNEHTWPGAQVGRTRAAIPSTAPADRAEVWIRPGLPPGATAWFGAAVVW